MIWLGLLVGALGLALAAMALLGARLPAEHVAACRLRLGASPEAVFAAISDFAALPGWRKDLSRVELLEPRGGRPAYREHSRHGAILFEVEALEPPRRLVTRIADDALPFGGTWTYELAPEGAGCLLTVTERGLVRPPLFRFLSRYAFGHTRTMEEYLRALAARFGEPSAPEVLSSGG